MSGVITVCRREKKGRKMNFAAKVEAGREVKPGERGAEVGWRRGNEALSLNLFLKKKKKIKSFLSENFLTNAT